MKRTSRWIYASMTALLLTVACDDDSSTGNPKNDGGSGGPMADGGMPQDSGGTGGEDAGVQGDAGSARGADNRPTLGTQIDRVGRPAVATALVATFSGDEAMKNATKDAYNAAGSDEWSDFEGEIAGSLGILDALDGTCGTQLLAGDPGEGRYDALAGVLADDKLYVNTASGSCGVYLGLEGEFVGAVPAGDGGCGGRTPLDDVIERSYSVLAAGALTGIDDTITEDDAVHDPTRFPWLAEPTL